MARLLREVRWRRIDEAGSETCRVWEEPDGYRFEGEARLAIDGRPAIVDYRIACGSTWETREARVDLRPEGGPTVTRHAGRPGREWLVDGVHASRLRGCVDVDIAATPATNTLPIRRIGLAIGESADVRAAWIRLPDLRVEPLDQRYTRVDALDYRYESGSGYRAALVVDDLGLIVSYGDVWAREA